MLTVRDQQVLLDRDVAALYGVETRAVNQAVKNNLAYASAVRVGEGQGSDWRGGQEIGDDETMMRNRQEHKAAL